MIKWTDTQLHRLKELEAPESKYYQIFDSIAQRDQMFQTLEKKLTRQTHLRLKEFRETLQRPELCRLEISIADTLIKEGFIQVTTPILMSKGLLKKMTISETHPLYSQIFWVNRDKCLRPMLAPHLYFLLKDLLRLWEKPIRIFEVGPCFRKDSSGSLHSQEFTMLNLVEMGIENDNRQDRLGHYAKLVMNTTGIEIFHFKKEDSILYGETIDIIAGPKEIEVGSAAMGPHSLDEQWKINASWVGIGFGLERLLMVKTNSQNLTKMGRSLAYLNGIRLNI